MMNDTTLASDALLETNATHSTSEYGLDSGIESSQSSSVSGPLALETDVLRYEAEDLTLTNYLIESNDVSSGGQHISLAGSDSLTGNASGVFTGESGTYQVSVGYYDENDGLASADITVGGDTESFTFDNDSAGGAPTAETSTEIVTHSAIELQTGDTFEIGGQMEFAEFARIDYIEFAQVESDAINNPSHNTPDVGGSEPVDGSLDPTLDPTIDVASSDPNKETTSSDPGKDVASEATASGTTYYVATNGSDDNPGTKEQPWKTIDYAVGDESAVEAGDTILVQEGEYTETITLEKSGNEDLGHITLKADGDVTLYDPDPDSGGFREGVIQSSGEGYWVIDGFRIENTSWAGISLRDANNMIVQNNHTYETGSSGIIVMPDSYYEGGEEEVTSSDIQVLDNTIERANWNYEGSGDNDGDQEALSIWGVDGFEVAGNTVTESNREGIDAKTGSRNGSIHDNTVTETALVSGTPAGYNGGSAIYVDGNRADSYNIDIYNNVVYSNQADAISVADEDPDQGDVSDIRIYNNVVYDNGEQGVNGGAGILVGSNVSDVEIYNNTVTDNVQALVIDGSDFTQGDQTSEVVVRNNIFSNSTYQNAYLEDANNVVLDNNLFTDDFEALYGGGEGLNNFRETNNSEVASVDFRNSQDQDFRLSAESPAVDAGSTDIPDYLSTDKDGEPRSQGEAPDIGAYEF